jgi:hypothetical protein
VVLGARARHAADEPVRPGVLVGRAEYHGRRAGSEGERRELG